jgi:hypothetical protein
MQKHGQNDIAEQIRAFIGDDRLYLPFPLDRGERGEVWVASPLEAITAEGLAVGKEFKVLYHSGVIGRLEVAAHRECSAEEFASVFSFDRAVKLV